jgi:hypothetical protein
MAGTRKTALETASPAFPHDPLKKVPRQVFDLIFCFFCLVPSQNGAEKPSTLLGSSCFSAGHAGQAGDWALVKESRCSRTVPAGGTSGNTALRHVKMFPRCSRAVPALFGAAGTRQAALEADLALLFPHSRLKN